MKSMLPEAALEYINGRVLHHLEEIAISPEKYLTSKWEDERETAKRAFNPVKESDLKTCSKCSGFGYTDSVYSRVPQVYCWHCNGTGYEDGIFFDEKKNIIFHKSRKEIKIKRLWS